MTQVEHVVIEKEVLVPVPAALTSPVLIPQVPASVDTLGLRTLYLETLKALMIANQKLIEIGGLDG